MLTFYFLENEHCSMGYVLYSSITDTHCNQPTKVLARHCARRKTTTLSRNLPLRGANM